MYGLERGLFPGSCSWYTGTPCEDTSPLGECDNGDTCDGHGYCDPNLKSGQCTDTTPSDCYKAVCTGSSVDCIQDLAPADAGTPCEDTAPLGECDNGDTCDDDGVCLDNLEPATTVCRESAGGCDIAEKCTGSSAECPADTYISCLTDSSLCEFDKEPDTLGEQFRLIFTPDTSISGWKLKASNPGQFYYSVMYYGPGDEDVTITLPKPFVTQERYPSTSIAG